MGTDLQLPPAAFRFVQLADADLSEDLVALALEHGAVSFTRLPRFEDDEPAVGLMLRTGAPWSVRAFNHRNEGLPGRVVVLLDDGEGAEASWDTPWVLEDPSRRGTWKSEHWRLEPHPLVAAPSRDWAWSWRGSSQGPIELVVRLRKSAEAIAGWAKTLWPAPYALLEAHRYRALAYDGGEHQHELRFFDGGLRLLRDFHDPAPERIAFDGALLRTLAAGALGPLTWDVIDGDMGHYLATGDDGPSLAHYLDPIADEQTQASRWAQTFARREVDATSASSAAEVMELLARALGAELGDLDFDAWFAAQSLESLPRNLRVTFSRAFEAEHHYQWFFDRVLRLQPRIKWSATTR